MINGDGKAPPPTESEYEKIEIFSNSVPIDAYLKLKQMLVESDDRIQQLIAANQDLKQEVSSLQNMVQTLMQENVSLRRSGAGSGNVGVGNGTSSALITSADGANNNGVAASSLAATFASAAAAAAAASSTTPSVWSPETQMRMAEFHRALLRENGLNGSSALVDFYAPPTITAAPTAADADYQSSLNRLQQQQQQHQQSNQQQQQRSQDLRENFVNNNNVMNLMNVNNNNHVNNNNIIQPLADVGGGGGGKLLSSTDDHNNATRFIVDNNNRNHTSTTALYNDDNVNKDGSGGGGGGVHSLQQRLNRTSNDLDKVANAAFRLHQNQPHNQQIQQQQPHQQQRPSWASSTSTMSAGHTRDDSSIQIGRVNSRGFTLSDEGKSGREGGGGGGAVGGRSHRNRPVSMFEPRLGMSRGGPGGGGVGSNNATDHGAARSGGGGSSVSGGVGGGGGVEALHHNHHHQHHYQSGVNEAGIVMNPAASPRPGWINSYSARGEGPAGNVHQVRWCIFLLSQKLTVIM